MGKRGPAPGSGGRPRKRNKPRVDGYRPATTGPAGYGTKTLEHRVKAGVVHAGPNVTVDHLTPGKKAKGSSANTQVVSRSENVKRERARAKKK